MNKLKSILVVAFVTVNLFSPLMAQNPEKVVSIVKEVHDFDWYKKQAIAWKKVLDTDSVNADAWLYFYTANRMAKICDYDNWKKQQKDYFMDLNKIVSKVEESIPNTFTSIYIRLWTVGVPSEEGELLLRKLLKMDLNKIEIIDELVTYYEIKRDKENIKKYCKKWFESGDMSEGILAYNYNVLMTLDENAIIFTGGDNDTYPIWILQNALGIRPDVVVINVSLIQIDDYRNALFTENKISTKPITKDKDFIHNMIDLILSNSNERPIYMAATVSPSLYKDKSNLFYLVGLAFKYEKSDFDNMAVIRKNFEKIYMLDYLRVSFLNDPSKSVTNQMNMSYLAMFFKLYEHYKMSGETDKVAEVKEFVRKIANDAENKDVMEWFK